MKYILGANYWGADWGNEMWLHYDGKKIREELKQLAEFGVQCLRVFPNWRDFQPVGRAYACRGAHGEYINVHTGMPVYDDVVDMDRIANFRDFCTAAEENGIKLVVSIVTGWMSGRLFVPSVLEGKNLITDPEALMWMRRFIHRFVKELKNEKSIIMWGLGNECNCLGNINNAFEAYVWTSTVADAIRSEDTSRPISSDMHSLVSGNDTSGWHMEYQGELTDMLTGHPYPSPTVGGDVEPYTRLRMTFLPTAQCLYYSGVSGKPAYIQESGTFSQTIGSNQMSADFMQIQILSSLVNGLKGYQWWCAWEQENLEYPPYSWAMMERQLGLFDSKRQPKPVAHTMKKMSEMLNKMPEDFPARRADGICLLTRQYDKQAVAISSLILAKQAGVDLDVVYTENGDIPDSKLYFMPCIEGWQVIYRKTWDVLLEKVANGATLYMSYNGGQITDFPSVIGAESMGVMAKASNTAYADGEQINYTAKEILLSPTTARVIMKNEKGNPIMLENKYGKGTVYFVNFPAEILAFEQPDGFNINPYYKLYKIVAEDVISEKPISTDNKNLFVTINPEDENNSIVSVLNYSDEDIVSDIRINDNWEIKEILYGNMESIPHCDGVILRITRKWRIFI